jgi:hypothetical protein
LRRLAVLAGLLLSFGPMAEAADVVVWGAPQAISGDSDVATNGSLVYAYNLGSVGVTTTTVNGVTFSAWDFPKYPTDLISTTTNGSVNFTESPGLLNSYNTLGTASGAFAGLTSDYQALLSTAGTTTNPKTLSLTLGGLTPGSFYEIQWWVNNSAMLDNPSFGETYLVTTATATNSVQLSGNVGNVSGDLGQFAIGSFTATGTSAIISFNGPNSGKRPIINAFQLREVPEPSTVVLSLFAVSTLGAISRRRMKSGS